MPRNTLSGWFIFVILIGELTLWRCPSPLIGLSPDPRGQESQAARGHPGDSPDFVLPSPGNMAELNDSVAVEHSGSMAMYVLLFPIVLSNLLMLK